VLAVLTTWLGVHHAHVNTARLARLVGSRPSGARVLGRNCDAAQLGSY
jgi:hypothetical protein